MEKSVIKGGVKGLVTLAMFVALSVVLGKFLQIPVGDSIRISFENLPLILAGVLYGPVAGLITAVCADLLGCFLRGYAIIPLITIAAGIIGLMSGIMRKLVKGNSYIKILAITIVPHILGSIILKSIALHFTYGQPWQLLALRLPIYLATAAAEAFIIYTFYSKNLMKYIGGKS